MNKCQDNCYQQEIKEQNGMEIPAAGNIALQT